MPASEKPWYNQTALHMVFGCTGLLLLVATVWMFGADHSRQWKTYQRKMRDVDVRLTRWRMQSEETTAKAEQQEMLRAELDEALASTPDDAALTRFIDTLREKDEAKAEELLADAAKIADASEQADRIELRATLRGKMDTILQRAKFEENELLRLRKFKSADYDEKKAIYDLGIRDGKFDELDGLQEDVNTQRDLRADLTLQYQAAASYRKTLDDSLKQMDGQAAELNKRIEEVDAEYGRLATTLAERKASWFTSTPPFAGKKWLELPILDAFNSPLKIDNLWTKNLTIPNGSFGEVTRFDRCTTCHKAIDRTAPGSAVAPLYEDANVVEVLLQTPDSRPQAVDGEEPTLLNVYGIGVAGTGLIETDDVTIRQIAPNSFAATAVNVGSTEAGLKVGDVLAYVDGSKVLSDKEASRFLLEQVNFGEPVELKVVRGLPQPFSSHPRLDLFVGSLSPHKISEMGCTICHEGQGSATNFKFVSHSPNSPGEQERWEQEYGWFNNHHWIYPMAPARFAESSCLKCHHDVVELESHVATQFDEAPAPKLTHGYNLINTYGCFGCHEINGYDGPDRRVGPDMRLEPNFFAAASQLQIDPGFVALEDDVQSWAKELVHHPERTQVRHQLLEVLTADKTSDDPVLNKESHGLIDALADVESPGTLRKVGPSLRHVATKVGPTWLYDWLKDPTHFRKSTRMPKFFGLYDHLDEGERATAERYEPIEILGLVTYLLKGSQPLELMEADDDLFGADDEQVARGRLLFETRGCLACHAHVDFPEGEAVHGPDLSNVGDKFATQDTPDSKRWLYSWLKNPSLYHPRTKMPDLYLDPIETEDGVTDPAADIAVYLMQSSNGWQPADDVAASLTPKAADLNDLVAEHLGSKLFLDDVDAAISSGRIPDHLAAGLDGAERLLADGQMTDEKKLSYIGAKTISKYGCYACHDIPGFEKAKPIGTGLADWGRKDPSKLAFEHIAEYLHHGHGSNHGGEHGDEAHSEGHGDDGHDEHAADMSSDDADAEIDEAFYNNRLLEHDRTGFIWQKLKEPRSYDYGKARNKDSFNDRLRMPLFPFNDQEREAVITFVLGLVAEPPAHEFVYQPDPAKKAMIAGHKALTKYNCVGCHIVEPEKWTIEIPAGSFEEQASNPTQTYPFMPHQFTTDELQASATPDAYRDTVTATLSGMPDLRSEDGRQRILDEEGDLWEDGGDYDPYFYPFELWQPTAIDGQPYQAGVMPIELAQDWIKRKQPTFGGDLTKLLLPRAVELEQEVNPQADGKQAYGWLPPPLLGEGNKVQTDWLHSFLLEPFMIRPAVLMRMPKFNMSPEEASALVNYFAAKDNAEYPYEFTGAQQVNRLEGVEEDYQAALADAAAKPPGETRFDHAMNIVTSNDYCVQCHMVGDFVPKTSERAMAPDLSVVYSRLRPNYLRRWLANPKQLLGYTPMPVNVTYDSSAENLGGVAQTLYHGTSVEQLDALVDLLMNYPEYAKSRAPVQKLVKPSAQPGSDDQASVVNE